ncbi:MAG: efflux RND transporter permease subunit [Acetobacteraceae bacterium]
MSISDPFLRRPIATSLLMLGILFFGCVAYRQLPIAALPTVDFPTINVSVQYPGASPDTMASSVATPLEQQFAAISGLDTMTSSSGVGTTSITLQFVLDRNIDGAAQDVQTAINAASGLLPTDLPNPPTYRKSNPADRPILIYALHSSVIPIWQVDDYAEVIVGQNLSTVPGVSQIIVAGAQKYAVRAQMNPRALAAHGIGLEDVRNALATTSVNRPKGNLENAHQSTALDTNDQLLSATTFQNVVIAYRNGAAVQLKDLGEAIDSVELNRVGAWYGDEPAILLLVQREAGANTIATAELVAARLRALRASVPGNVAIDLISDRTQTIRASVADVQFTLLLSVSLVVGVIFVFLRKAWATVIPAVVVPLSIIGTFAGMYLFGYSLDNLSLMGITIAVGFLVDDAIVMIENIVRFIEAGDTPFAAAVKGAGQVGFTILSITFSLVAAFIPLLLMGGIVGRLFREFAVTVTMAILLSGAIALTLTPVMCAQFLKFESKSGRGPGHWAEAGFDAILHGYDRSLRWVLRHQFPALLFTLGLICATVALYIVVPKGFFPQQDTGFIYGEADGSEDISFNGMRVLTEQLGELIRRDPAVASVGTFLGATGGNASENAARMMIQLKPYNQRDVTAEQVIARLRRAAAAVSGIKFFMQAGQDISVGGRLSRTQYQYTLTDTNSDELNRWAPVVLQHMTTLPGLRDVASDQQIAAAHLALTVDRVTAARLGVSMQMVDDTLYDAFGARDIGTIYTAANQYRIILEVQPQFQEDADSLAMIYVPGSNGAQVPLSAFIRMEPKAEPLVVNHLSEFPAVTLSFNLAPGTSLGQAVERISQMTDGLRLPATVRGSFQGTAQAFQSSMTTMPLLIAAAIIVVYIVLGMLYESYVHPLTILSSLPSAGVGALLILALLGYDLDVMAIIGIVLLIGIVKKNAIMMVDFALEGQRREGRSPLDAIHQACLLRFRPIMMTTMSALLGSLPLAVGMGAGSELRRPLGIAIVGGLLVSQSLTLYTVPVIYLYLERLSQWLRGSAKGAAAQRRVTAVQQVGD